MKKFSLKTLCVLFILSISSNSINAQPVEEILPPIIDLILNGPAPNVPIIIEPENRPPVNTVPNTQLEFDFFQILLFQEIPVSVDDEDGNLTSIRFSSQQSPQFVRLDILDRLIPGITFQQNPDGFTITGTQSSLMSAISDFIIVPITGDTTYFINMFSTDEEGATDSDSFSIRINGGGFGGF